MTYTHSYTNTPNYSFLMSVCEDSNMEDSSGNPDGARQSQPPLKFVILVR